MRCESCHVKGDMEPGFFEEQVQAVTEKMSGEEDIPVTIVAVEDQENCAEAVADVPINDREAFIEHCRNTDTSLSIRIDNQEFVIVKADKPFVQDNAAAMRGLLAHELMHTVQRHQGVEEDIETVARSYEESAINDLAELGLDRQEVARFIRTVFSTAIFSLKDIYANTELIRQSFASDLEEYYHNMLGIESYCPAPDFYGEEAELDEVQDALTFELGLLPAWLPFEALNHPQADEIRHRIQDCYEKDIPQVAYYVHKIRDLYHDDYNHPDEFKNRFFQQIFDSAYEVIEKKELDS